MTQQKLYEKNFDFEVQYLNNFIENVQIFRHSVPTFAPVFPHFGMICYVGSGAENFRLYLSHL